MGRRNAGCFSAQHDGSISSDSQECCCDVYTSLDESGREWSDRQCGPSCGSKALPLRDLRPNVDHLAAECRVCYRLERCDDRSIIDNGVSSVAREASGRRGGRRCARKLHPARATHCHSLNKHSCCACFADEYLYDDVRQEDEQFSAETLDEASYMRREIRRMLAESNGPAASSSAASGVAADGWTWDDADERPHRVNGLGRYGRNADTLVGTLSSFVGHRITVELKPQSQRQHQHPGSGLGQGQGRQGPAVVSTSVEGVLAAPVERSLSMVLSDATITTTTLGASSSARTHVERVSEHRIEGATIRCVRLPTTALRPASASSGAASASATPQMMSMHLLRYQREAEKRSGTRYHKKAR
jgi:hypothetical protein